MATNKIYFRFFQFLIRPFDIYVQNVAIPKKTEADICIFNFSRPHGKGAGTDQEESYT
jgi:hypothetical protein